MDQPLGLIRSDYSYDFADPVLIVPHANWRSAYETSTFADGSSSKCVTVWMPANEVLRRDTAGRWSFPADAPDTTQVRCIERDLPGAYMGMTRLLKRQTVWGPISWIGSVVQDGQDASGLSYRRNRYYDPSTGRFTQEDPIGIEGGLNVYGFGDGDPISYSDPYGLDPCQESSAWTDCLAIALANWGGEHHNSTAVFVGAAASGVFESFGINAAASAGDHIGNGRILEGGGQAAILIGGGVLAGRFAGLASRMLVRVGAEEVGEVAATSKVNPFRGKTAEEIDAMLRSRGFEPRGPDPVNGKGGYVNPRTTRSYHIDVENSFGEHPHVDVNRPRGYRGSLPKKKLPM